MSGKVLTALRTGFVVGLRDVALGTACAGCGRPGEVLCLRCIQPLRAMAHRSTPDPEPTGLPRVWAVATYDGAVRAAVCAYKEHGALGLVHPLGQALATSAAAAVRSLAAAGTCCADCAERYVLVSVPSSPAVVRARGHDATARLARAAATGLRRQGLDVVVGLALGQQRSVADQVGLSAQARSANVTGAFRVVPSRRRLLEGRAILLVDDVVTSGATLAEAARAVSAAGFEVAAGAVVAATARRRVATTPHQRDPIP